MTQTDAAAIVGPPVPAGWPDAPHPDAYDGLAGAIVETIAPHTEADPVAILGQLLVACGSVTGPPSLS